MSLRNIGIVYRKELIDSLRDRRTVISMIVVPMLVMPVLTIGMGILSLLCSAQAMKEIPTVMILGGEDSPRVLAALHALPEMCALFRPRRTIAAGNFRQTNSRRSGNSRGI